VSALPEWRQSNLPQPPPCTPGNLVRVIGPGGLLLGLSLGSGDWLLGPAITARHGPSILWICAVSVILQALLNMEMARYTLATGESIFTGFMRTRPGAGFWGWSYSLLHLLQMGWPGWALAAATALAAAFLGRMPRDEDRVVVVALGYLLFLGAVAVVVLGNRLHRTVEGLERGMMAWTLLFLLGIAIFLVPGSAWLQVGAGFVGPLAGAFWLPANLDWMLLVGFAAYSGGGGTINATLTHWLRDKGFGMASTVAAPPTAIGGQTISLSRPGAIFPRSEANLAKWSGWWSYLGAGFGYLWAVGGLLGMALPVVITITYVKPGTEMGGLAAGAFLARALAERHGLLLWFPTLLASFWILVSGQLGIVEGFARNVTDILWTASPRLRRPSAGGSVNALYYAVLGVFTLCGCLALSLADPLRLILIGANVAAVNFAILSLHTLWVNRALLPRELRPSLWREAAVLACALFFAGLVAMALFQPEEVIGPIGH
jgi:hypothetical protein